MKNGFQLFFQNGNSVKAILGLLIVYTSLVSVLLAQIKFLASHRSVKSVFGERVKEYGCVGIICAYMFYPFGDSSVGREEKHT